MSRVYSIGNTTVRSLSIDDGVEMCIIVSVNPQKESEVMKLCRKVVRFKYSEKFPFDINYENPLHAGADRVAFAAFAFYEGIYPAYLLDAGTFITLDYFSGRTLYPVATVPGFGLLKDALRRGYNLKGLSPREFEGEFPKAPEETLYNGIYRVTGCGLGCFIKKDVHLLITGGDAEIIKKLLKKGICVNNAVLYGAYYAFKNGLF